MKEKKKFGKGKIILIIVSLFIFCLIAIGVMTKISSKNSLDNLKAKADDAMEKIYELSGGKENYEKEKIFKQISNELPENNKLVDIKIDGNSNSITFILVEEKTPNKIYNWLESGISEEQANALDSKTRNSLTSLYGPKYIYTDKIEYCIYNRFTNETKNRTLSLEETITSSKWKGLEYNWETYGNLDTNIMGIETEEVENMRKGDFSCYAGIYTGEGEIWTLTKEGNIINNTYGGSFKVDKINIDLNGSITLICEFENFILYPIGVNATVNQIETDSSKIRLFHSMESETFLYKQ